jgi:hypothetical protein
MSKGPGNRRVTVAVSGSFHRHLDEIMSCVQTLRDMRIEVLSPSDPRVVDADGPFLFVASDRHRSVRLVQDRHLGAIHQADFVWLVCPDGYVGQSAALEIGFAVACGVSIYSTTLPADLTLRQYVTHVNGIREAVARERSFDQRRDTTPTLLVNPMEVVEDLHHDLDDVAEVLTGRRALATRQLEAVVADRLGRIRDVVNAPSVSTD